MKAVQDLYWKKYETVLEDIKNPNKFKKYHVHGSGHSVL